MVDGSAVPPAGGPTPPPAPPVYASASASPKSPILSAIVSFLIPGVGQIINGQLKKGLIILVGYIILWIVVTGGYFLLSFLSIIVSGIGFCCCLPVFFVPFLVNLYAAYDAYKSAKAINAGQFVKDWMS